MISQLEAAIENLNSDLLRLNDAIYGLYDIHGISLPPEQPVESTEPEPSRIGKMIYSVYMMRQFVDRQTSLVRNVNGYLSEGEAKVSGPTPNPQYKHQAFGVSGAIVEGDPRTVTGRIADPSYGGDQKG